MVDIVYIYQGPLSIWRELQMSLRSVAMNFRGEYKIWIIGTVPTWVKEVTGIECPQQIPEFHAKAYDQNYRIMKFLEINEDEPNRDMILMHDDMFLLKPMTIEDLRGPFYHSKKDKVPAKGSSYIKLLNKTLDLFKGDNVYNYETHMPRVMDRGLLLSVMRFLNSVEECHIIASLYYNFWYVKEPLFYRPYKIGFYGRDDAAGFSSDDTMWIKQNMKGKMLCNVSNDGLTPEMCKILADLFPEPCKFEI